MSWNKCDIDIVSVNKLDNRRYGASKMNLLFYVPPIVCGGSVLVFVLVCITLCPF